MNSFEGQINTDETRKGMSANSAIGSSSRVFTAAPSWQAKRNAFRRALMKWYRRNGRDLPWRRTRDPYAVLVSEFMLQQTQVATVLPYYSAWIRRFPDFPTLAQSAESAVLHAWQGLGYYDRARNLHGLAQIVTRSHAGALPRDLLAIRHLPGVGRYTANAIASFAFDAPLPVVEANIGRVLARLLDLREPIDSAAGRETLWDFAALLMPQRQPSAHNSALMDLGALICTAGKPQCGICPVRSFCRAREPALLPIKRMRPRIELLSEHHSFAVHGDRVLLEQSHARWRGMWILPRWSGRPATGVPLHTAEFPFTNHRVTLSVFRQPRRAPALTAAHWWFSFNELQALPVPSPHRRALNHLLARSS
ncbi:MAG: A/G-specific adenine glycosylase [Chthoniobacterales bacterium]